MWAHRRGERGRPGAAARGEALEYFAFDHDLLAAQFEKIELFLAQLLDPLSAAKVYGNRISALNINVLP